MQVEDAVAVQVVSRRRCRRARRRAVLAGLVRRREAVVARLRQLAGVEPGLAAQVLHRAGVVPLDPRVEDRDRHVGAAGRGHEGGRRRSASSSTTWAPRTPPSSTGLVLCERVAGIGGRRELELVAAEVVADLAGVQVEVGRSRSGRRLRACRGRPRAPGRRGARTSSAASGSGSRRGDPARLIPASPSRSPPRSGPTPAATLSLPPPQVTRSRPPPTTRSVVAGAAVDPVAAARRRAGRRCRRRRATLSAPVLPWIRSSPEPPLSESSPSAPRIRSLPLAAVEPVVALLALEQVVAARRPWPGRCPRRPRRSRRRRRRTIRSLPPPPRIARRRRRADDPRRGAVDGRRAVRVRPPPPPGSVGSIGVTGLPPAPGCRRREPDRDEAAPVAGVVAVEDGRVAGASPICAGGQRVALWTSPGRLASSALEHGAPVGGLRRSGRRRRALVALGARRRASRRRARVQREVDAGPSAAARATGPDGARRAGVGAVVGRAELVVVEGPPLVVGAVAGVDAGVPEEATSPRG